MDNLLVRICEQQQGFIRKIAANEGVIAQFYQTMAVKFTEFNDVWRGLAEDEQEHQKVLNEIADQVAEKSIVLSGFEGYNKEDLDKLTDFIENHMKRIKEGKVTLPIALASALSIERSLAESPFFQQVHSADEELENKLRKISQDTQTHYNTIDRINTEVSSRSFR